MTLKLHPKSYRYSNSLHCKLCGGTNLYFLFRQNLLTSICRHCHLDKRRKNYKWTEQDKIKKTAYWHKNKEIFREKRRAQKELRNKRRRFKVIHEQTQELMRLLEYWDRDKMSSLNLAKTIVNLGFRKRNLNAKNKMLHPIL